MKVDDLDIKPGDKPMARAEKVKELLIAERFWESSALHELSEDVWSKRTLIARAGLSSVVYSCRVCSAIPHSCKNRRRPDSRGKSKELTPIR